VIPRYLTDRIQQRLQAGDKVVLIFGARQVGKTTLVNQILERTTYRVLYVNGDEPRQTDALSSRNSRQLRGLVEGYDVLFIDEAQRIPEIGINLKILADQFPSLRIIATGSSTLDLASRTREPLTGRAWLHELYPIALLELAAQHTRFELDQQLDERLIYGSYPLVFNVHNAVERREQLLTLASSYLYKDILDLKGIRYAAQIRDLLRLLAFQIGNLISLTELGTQLGMSRDTVDSYVDLLEQAFVVFRLTGYSRNLRKEVRKQYKVYFWDVGIRNAVIDNFFALNQRADVGALWENFVIAERRKWLRYTGTPGSLYFWRTHTGAELDFVEEGGGQLRGFECKWSKTRVRAPQSFLDAYPNEATFNVIDRVNYLDFLGSAPAS
jgi:hypothetical protein